MNRQLLFAAVIVIAFAAGASAQSGTGMTGPGAGTGTGRTGQAGQGGTMNQGGMAGGGFGIIDFFKGDGDITMRGCLARSDGTELPTGHAFVLTNVKTGAPSSATAVREVTGTSGTAPVTLTGHDTDLRKFVGQRVELRGKLDTSRKGMPTNGMLFKVSSVKGLEGTCSPAAR